MSPTILAIAEELERIQSCNRDLRVGQLISSLSPHCDPFYVTDADLLQALKLVDTSKIIPKESNE